jgi:LysM repeat protein
MAVPQGQFTLQSFDPSHFFQAAFDNEAPLPTSDSYGGWTVVPVPKRMGISEWGGRTPLGLEVSFYIDKTNVDPDRSPGENLEKHFNALEHMAGTGERDDEPPTVIFQSDGLCPHDYTLNPHIQWVIETLTWDRERFVNNKWNRPIFFAGSFVLRQFNDDAVLDAYKGPAKKNRDKHKGKEKGKKGKVHSDKRRYRVKEGDTLSRIAKDLLGDAQRWRDIADLNDLRHPRKELKAGTVLRIPKK